ncbi:MAG TPA: Nif3-like dinuclear metal center hexameric protein [Clostridiales bacterium]|jgi:dinuclear metal center YbgI/SA1388 family protein|nr:Nif3-like dinuclear metal center hexameric protein [Clostridiales bacterium]HQP69915.1 Nif3-like dinuclear metal center hexameric protein [Clostridiales bacterium]
MRVVEVLNILDKKIIPQVKWKNDPSGLLIGDKNAEVKAILTALNPTLEVAKEAKAKKCNLIVSHHPLFKKPVSELVEGEYYSDMIRFLIKNEISLISCHTNYDLLSDGVSYLLAEALGLKNIKPLIPIKAVKDIEVNELYKLVVYCPAGSEEKIKSAVDYAGGAVIGNYDHCYFSASGEGDFRPGEGADPFIGKKGKIEKVKEIRIETVASAWNKDKIVSAIKSVHHYEEPVIDVYPLDNNSDRFGLGAIGELKKKLSLKEFCYLVSEKLGTDTLRIAVKDSKVKIGKVAVCGGSGATSWKFAYKAGADVFLTSEFSHHLYQEASYYINVIDATHHSTEQFAKEGLYKYLRRSIGRNFRIETSKTDTDVVKSLKELK